MDAAARARREVLALATFVVIAPPLAAQDAPLASGIAAEARGAYPEARADFERELHRDPRSYPASWHLALVLTAMAKATRDPKQDSTRDALFADAEKYARRAIALDPSLADGHFALADALGEAALRGPLRQRVQSADEVRAEALRATELDPRHDGAWHILGRWNAEVMRLSPIDRLIARKFLGGAAFATASWDEAERDLRRAVAIAPDRIVHHFDLAQILAWRHEWAGARVELDRVETLPSTDVSDTTWKREGRALQVTVMKHLDR